MFDWMRKSPTRVGLGGGLLVFLAISTAVDAQGHAEGMVIRVQQSTKSTLVFIDVGANDGVMRGDLYNIVSSEVLSHPLTGDTLAVTPMNVGAIQVHQVNEKLAIAKLLHLMPGEDAMLKPIAKVRDPDRLAEIEKLVSRARFKARGGSAPRNTALIPGMYQMKVGEKRKGWALLASDAVALVAAFGYRANSNDWKDQYNNLDASQPQGVFKFYFSRAASRRNTSNRLFWLAGAIYAYNWADVLWLGESAKMMAHTAPAKSTQFGLGATSDGDPLFSIQHRF